MFGAASSGGPHRERDFYRSRPLPRRHASRVATLHDRSCRSAHRRLPPLLHQSEAGGRSRCSRCSRCRCSSGSGCAGARTPRSRSCRRRADVLEVENRSYRAATGELTAQLQSLQTAVTQLGEGSALDPEGPARHRAAAGHREVACGRRSSAVSRQTAPASCSFPASTCRKTPSACCATCCTASRAASGPCRRASSAGRRWPPRRRRSGRRTAG